MSFLVLEDNTLLYMQLYQDLETMSCVHKNTFSVVCRCLKGRKSRKFVHAHVPQLYMALGIIKVFVYVIELEGY